MASIGALLGLRVLVVGLGKEIVRKNNRVAEQCGKDIRLEMVVTVEFKDESIVCFTNGRIDRYLDGTNLHQGHVEKIPFRAIINNGYNLVIFPYPKT